MITVFRSGMTTTVRFRIQSNLSESNPTENFCRGCHSQCCARLLCVREAIFAGGWQYHVTTECNALFTVPPFILPHVQHMTPGLIINISSFGNQHLITTFK